MVVGDVLVTREVAILDNECGVHQIPYAGICILAWGGSIFRKKQGIKGGELDENTRDNCHALGYTSRSSWRGCLR